MNREGILNRIGTHKDEIKQYGVKRLVLVGSYAREEANKSSDIDFLVEFEEGRGLFDDYIGLKRTLENILNHEIDLIKRKLVRKELKQSILGGKKIEATV